MIADDLLDTMRRRRTARAHDGVTIPAAALAAVLEAARWAPSAANRQPWEFVVVDDRALQRALRDAFRDEAKDRDPRYRSVTEKQADLLTAPALILVCGDPRSKSRYVNAEAIGDAAQEELFLLSMGAAIQNALLMASACGLTATWIARAARLPEIRRLLAVPDDIRTIAFLALGMADRPPTWDEHMRTPVAGKCHANRYGERPRG